MPANEFERQVQEQLGQFQLNPSASVWQKVEEQIKEKKRRRIILFILLPLAILSVGISWYLLTSQPSHTGLAKTSVPAPSTSSAPLTPHAGTTAIEPSNKDLISDGVNHQVESPSEKTLRSNDRTAEIIRPGETSSSTRKEQKAGLRKNEESNINVAVKQPTKATAASSTSDPGSLNIIVDAANTAKRSGADMTGTNSDARDTAAEKREPVVAVTTVDENEKAIKDTISTTLVVESKPDETRPKTGKKNASGFQWGITGGVGIAGNNKGSINFARAEAFDMNYALGSASNANPQNIILPPAVVNNGMAFRLGIVGDWRTGKRSSVSAGLQYSYLSNRMNVGSPKDTNITVRSVSTNFSTAVDVDKIYSGSQTNAFVNRYHFVQLPVWYHWQVARKLPLQLDLGLSAGFLVATNALVYESGLGGVYYHDRKAFTPVHFNFNTGLSYKITGKNKAEWKIGPEISFDLSRLVKNDSKQYLMYTGIGATWLLPKKKK